MAGPTRAVAVPAGTLLGHAIAESGLPLEQPCAGRGTCGKCRVLVEAGIAPPGEVELRQLTPEELALNNRLACCARVESDAVVVLAPVAVYSAKAFYASDAYRSRPSAPLGVAIDLGSTTVAACLPHPVGDGRGLDRGRQPQSTRHVWGRCDLAPGGRPKQRAGPMAFRATSPLLR